MRQVGSILVLALVAGCSMAPTEADLHTCPAPIGSAYLDPQPGIKNMRAIATLSDHNLTINVVNRLLQQSNCFRIADTGDFSRNQVVGIEPIPAPPATDYTILLSVNSEDSGPAYGAIGYQPGFVTKSVAAVRVTVNDARTSKLYATTTGIEKLADYQNIVSFQTNDFRRGENEAIKAAFIKAISALSDQIRSGVPQQN